MRQKQTTLGLLLIVITGSSLFAAKKVSAPRAALLQGHNVVVLATAKAFLADHVIEFACEETLFGEPCETLEVRFEPSMAQRVGLNLRYVVGASDWIKGRYPVPDRRDPLGFRAIRLAGVQEALFPATPWVLALLSAEEVADPLKHILAGLQSSQPQIQRLAVAELVFRPGAAREVPKEAGPSFLTFVGDRDADPMARDLLLTSRASLPLLEQDTLSVARHIIATAPTSLDLGSPHPALVITAFRVLRGKETSADVPALKRWLASNAANLADKALTALKRVDPQGALDAARAAADRALLEAETRAMLRSFIERTERAFG